MPDILSGVVIGAELAVFFVILIYAILIDATSKSKLSNSINLFASALILASGIKFFATLFEIKSMLPDVLTSLLSLVAGLGLILFLSNISKNIKDYR